MKYIILTFLYIFSLGVINAQIDSKFSILIDPNKAITDGKMSDLFESYTFVRLETKPESLIGRAYVAEIYNNNISVLDRAGEMSIKTFSLETGRFINKISNYGRGPGEYLFLIDFTIDKDGYLYLIDGSQALKYNQEGSFIKRYDLDYPAERIISFGDNRFILSASYEVPELAIVNSKFKTIKTLFPYEIYKNGHSNILQSAGGSIYYLKINSGMFFEIDEAGEIPFLDIAIKGYTPNRRITEEAIRNSGKNNLTINNHYEHKIIKKGFLPVNLLINSTQLYGKIIHDKDRYLLRYSFITKHHELYDLHKFLNDITGDHDNFSQLILTEDNILLCFIEPFRILKKDKNELDSKLLKVSRRVNEESNYIVFIGKLKSF